MSVILIKEHDESIYDVVQDHVAIRSKSPRYTSVHREWIKCEIKQKQESHRNMGYAKYPQRPPTKFLKAHTGSALKKPKRLDCEQLLCKALNVPKKPPVPKNVHEISEKVLCKTKIKTPCNCDEDCKCPNRYDRELCNCRKESCTSCQSPKQEVLSPKSIKVCGCKGSCICENTRNATYCDCQGQCSCQWNQAEQNKEVPKSVKTCKCSGDCNCENKWIKKDTEDSKNTPKTICRCQNETSKPINVRTVSMCQCGGNCKCPNTSYKVSCMCKGECRCQWKPIPEKVEKARMEPVEKADKKEKYDNKILR